MHGRARVYYVQALCPFKAVIIENNISNDVRIFKNKNEHFN